MWTPEREETLRRLWAAGRSAREIADELGAGSRNAVIGKIHREGLQGRPAVGVVVTRPPRPARPTRPKAERKRNDYRVRKPRPPAVRDAPPTAPDDLPVRPPDDLTAPESRRLILMDLRADDCRWPDGERYDRAETFCGHQAWVRPTKAGLRTGPYCAYHSRIAYVPQPSRRRDDSMINSFTRFDR